MESLFTLFPGNQLTTIEQPEIPGGFTDWCEGQGLLGVKVWAAWVETLREELLEGQRRLSPEQFNALYRAGFSAFLGDDKAQNLRDFFPLLSSGILDSKELARRAEAALVIIEALLDLNTGPLNLRSAVPVTEQTSEVRNPAGWADGLPSVIQTIFAFPKGKELDDLALEVTHGTASGILGLAGHRGTGKSSILYRIEQYAQRWLMYEQRRPLLIRFDLGTDFAPREFLRNFMEEICRAASAHCERPPMIPTGIVLGGFVRCIRQLIGGVGRWAQVNRNWALAVAILAAIGMSSLREWKPSSMAPGLAEVSQQGWENSKAWWNMPGLTICELILNRNVALLLPLLAALAILWAGFAHSAQRNLNLRSRRSRGTPPSAVPNRDGVVVLFGLVTLMAGIGTLCLVHSKELFPTTVMSLWFWWLAIFGAAQFLLPGWWLTLAHCRAMLIALRSSGNGRATEFAFIPGLSRLLEALLPSNIYAPDIRNMEAPFLEQEIKHLLRECVAGFGRVVILIDDVDALPSAHFHTLLRSLRPLSKVVGVEVVVSLPRFFFDVWRLDRLGDLHSTLRELYLVGDPDRHPEPLYAYREPDLSEFKKALEQMLQGRVQLPVSLEVGLTEGVDSDNRKLQLVQDVTAEWENNFSNVDAFDRWVKEMQPTLREIIRETRELLASGGGSRFSSKRVSLEKMKALSKKSKREYFDTETALAAPHPVLPKLKRKSALRQPKPPVDGK